MEISRYPGFIGFTYYCIRRQRTKKHIYIGTYIIYWNLIVTSLPGLRLTLSSLNFELANLIPPRPTNQAHSSVTKSDSIEQLIKVQFIKRGNKHISIHPSEANQPTPLLSQFTEFDAIELRIQLIKVQFRKRGNKHISEMLKAPK